MNNVTCVACGSNSNVFTVLLPLDEQTFACQEHLSGVISASDGLCGVMKYTGEVDVEMLASPSRYTVEFSHPSRPGRWVETNNISTRDKSLDELIAETEDASRQWPGTIYRLVEDQKVHAVRVHHQVVI